MTDDGSLPPTDPTTPPVSADATTPSESGSSPDSRRDTVAIALRQGLLSKHLDWLTSSPTGRFIAQIQDERIYEVPLYYSPHVVRPEVFPLIGLTLETVDYSKIEARIAWHYTKNGLLLRWQLERTCRELSDAFQKMSRAGSLSADALRKMKKSIGHIRYRLRYLRRGSPKKSRNPTRR